MIAGEILAVALALGLAAYLVAPLLRADAAESERVGAAASDLRDLGSKREMLLAALRDLEDDHASDKIDERDYRELHARLETEAVDVMRQIEALELARSTSTPVEVPQRRMPPSEPPA